MSPDNGLSEMLTKLQAFLPAPPGAPLPDPSVAASGLTERAVGIGDRRGEDLRAGFDVVALKGKRLDATVRFQLWADQLPKVEQAIQDLNARLLSSRDQLRAAGFLEFTLRSISTSENVPNIGFRDTVEYHVLYEHQFEDSDGADSILASIPVLIDSVYHTTTLVTDGMTRWDKNNAAALSVRGPFTFDRLTALFLLSTPPPTGAVSLTRTNDNASAPPLVAADLTAFLVEVTGPQPKSVNAQVSFPSVTDFLGAFKPSGNPVTLGTDLYVAEQLLFQQPVILPYAADRFEVSYHNPSFDQPSIIYLRARAG